jgi:hypothetical protein
VSPVDRILASDPDAILGRMNVFISSPIGGLEPFRDVAGRAAGALRHEVKRSEDFGASANTPQQACLAGVRWADAVVLLLGARYGDPQPSGLSATHEEYREAKSRCSVLAFVQRDVEREATQQELVDEVRSWAGGVLTGDFASPEELQDAVTRALHELELAQQAGPLDEEEMVERARALIPDRYGLQGAVLCVASASGPRQPILRPAQLEERTLERDLHREVLLGQNAVFDTTEGVQVRIEGQAIVLEQPRASLRVDSLGSVGLVQPATDPDGSGLPALIEEEVGDRLARSFRLTAWILDRIDPVRRLSHVAPSVALLSAAYLGWRTRDEHAASPSSIQMPTNVGDRVVVALTPIARPRGALTYEVPELREDFLALLRRTYKA